MKETNKKYWDQVREFNLSRTPFWISFAFQVFLTIGPFLIIWILVGADFKANSFNSYDQLQAPSAGYLALIVVCYLIYAILMNAITWLVRGQKADSFTYTFGLSFVFAAIILNGIGIVDGPNVDTILKLLVRFVLAIVFGLMGVFFGVVITTFARNADYKIEEENYELLQAYRDGQKVAHHHKKRLKKALNQEKRQAKKTSKTNSEMDKKLVQEYDSYAAKQKAKKAHKQTQLDAKETKKRTKKTKKK